MVLHTDSEYVRNGITRLHTGWVRRNWRNAAGDPVANMDLWRRLLDAAKPHQVEWRWVRGHAGDDGCGDLGAGRGEGYTVNLPVPPGAGSDEFLGLVQHVVAPPPSLSCTAHMCEHDPTSPGRLSVSTLRGLA